MDRPGPLKDIPLACFVPAAARKRPLSPAPPLSPAKRRILHQEGIYTPSNPRSSFSDVLAGPSSPAKRLDFGSPKQTPQGSRLKNLDDCFGQPSTSSPQPDPQSIHYPGFSVYYDPQVDNTLSLLPTSDKDKDAATKENIPPRRKTRKSATAPPEKQLLTPPTKRRESERLKAKSTPATPKKSLMGDRVQHGSPTPRRTIFGQEATFTPRLSMRRLRDDEETAMA
ncbi:hypothetical protein J132_06144 [Termitomyces sp. J132]|nr:hypothetical protein H2248_006560 [Termitomyces sp. 'cryptogamus']KNZ77149.1 hypothetical protein J132_06144 [Termitomyces sp. J132]